MSIGHPSAIRGMERWLVQRCDGAAPDASLLERFIEQKDARAFEVLLRRHGPMVMGVCRRVLANSADAEDAFQATFLVLVKKARCVRPRSRLGNWLHGVAQRTALKAKSMNHLWRQKQQRSRLRPTQVAPHPVDAEWLADLDAELALLPAPNREAIVLCELEGKTIKEAATQLGIPAGTVASRLTRGRTQLAQALRRRGHALALGTLAAAGPQAVGGQVLARTMHSAQMLAQGAALTASVASGRVALLVEGVIKTMFFRKLQGIAVLIAASLLALVSGSMLSQATAPAADEDKKAASKAAEIKEAPEKKKPRPVALELTEPLLDALGQNLCAALATQMRKERKAKDFATSPELARVLQKTFNDNEALALLVKDLNKEEAGKDRCSPVVLDLLGDAIHRHQDVLSCAFLGTPKEVLKACSQRRDLLHQLHHRFGGVAFSTDRNQKELDAAIERINQVRTQAGLKALPQNAVAGPMARRHALYLDLNRDRAKAGLAFAGDQAVDRQVAGRVADSSNGDMLAQSSLVGFGRPVEVVDAWLATFSARIALLRPDLKGLGVNRLLSIAPEASEQIVVAQYTDVSGTVPPVATIVSLPSDGAKDVPLRLVDQRPSLLPADAKRDALGHAEAGYPLTVTFWGSFAVTKASAKLEVKKGDAWEKTPAYVFTPDAPAIKDWACNLGTIALIAKAPLEARKTYRAHFSAIVNDKPWTQTLTFETAAAIVPPSVSPLRYASGPVNSLNNAFRFNASMLLASDEAYALENDEKYLAALDSAFYKLILWRARYEEKAGSIQAWQPALQLVKEGWAPGRKEVAELLSKADKPAAFPKDALDVIADHAVRYRELAVQADAPDAVRRQAQKRLDALLGFYRAHGGKDLAELEAKVQDMAQRGLDAFNEYRTRLKLPPVTLDERLSRACRRHAVYMDLNRGEGREAWTFWGQPTPHVAEAGLPGFCPAGAFAGSTSVIAMSTPEDCVHGWMSSFFHRIPLLSPEAKNIGIGFGYSADAFAEGTGRIALLSVPAITRKSAKEAVVLYPEKGAKDILRNYGLESPNPIAKPEKKDDRGWPVAGFPVTATFFGREKITKASGRLFLKKGDGWEEVACYFSSPEQPASYFSDNLNTLCLMAKDWLAPNATYKAEFEAVLDGTEWRGEAMFETGDEKALVGEKKRR